MGYCRELSGVREGAPGAKRGSENCKVGFPHLPHIFEYGYTILTQNNLHSHSPPPFDTWGNLSPPAKLPAVTHILHSLAICKIRSL